MDTHTYKCTYFRFLNKSGIDVCCYVEDVYKTVFFFFSWLLLEGKIKCKMLQVVNIQSTGKDFKMQAYVYFYALILKESNIALGNIFLLLESKFCKKLKFYPKSCKRISIFVDSSEIAIKKSPNLNYTGPRCV